MGKTADVCWPKPKRHKLLVGTGIALAAVVGGAAGAKTFTAWGPAVNAQNLDGSHADLNTPSNDGCPIMSPYDNSLYIASTRDGSIGGLLDIWIAPPSGDGWGRPVPAGEPINTAAEEFCPSPARGNRFFFVRRLSATDTDIYMVKKLPTGWGTPQPLPKGPGKINSDKEEWSPSWFESADGREFLYFSSTRNAGAGHDIFYSVDFGDAQYAPGGVNAPMASSDARPNVRHDGLEIVWDSNRAGSRGLDIWTASRSSVDADWGTAAQLGTDVNSAANETRPSLSWDGTMLLFGSNRPGGEGSADVHLSRRSKVTGRK